MTSKDLRTALKISILLMSEQIIVARENKQQKLDLFFFFVISF